MDEFNDDEKRFIDLSLNADLTEKEWESQFDKVLLQQYRLDTSLRREITNQKILIQKSEDERKKIKQNGGFTDEVIKQANDELIAMLKDSDPRIVLEAIKLMIKANITYGSVFQAKQAEKDSGVVGGDASDGLNVFLGG